MYTDGDFDGETKCFRRNVNTRRAAKFKGLQSKRKNRQRG